MATALEKIQQKKEKIEALQKEVRRLANVEASKQRKKLTRQKIILGGALLAHAEKDDNAEKFQKVIDVLKSHLSEKDKKAFE